MRPRECWKWSIRSRDRILRKIFLFFFQRMVPETRVMKSQNWGLESVEVFQ